MAAPKNNNYWQFRNKHGRDFKYTPEGLWDEAVKYFEWMEERVWNKKEAIKSGDLAGTIMDIPITTPMSIESFCLFADIDENTFSRYEKEKGYEDFWGVTTRVRKIIESQQLEGATVGTYNANIIARKLGLADKTDVTSKGEAISFGAFLKKSSTINDKSE
ncbi:DNA-packaging protein [Chryseobacterium manosquense]|uniref:DNA-packaging protein n=1 Tax=Chryseobacterium manosquense TaxID=2754694 RepID=A0A7H1DTA3_9FLAO|nr:terminase small subunit [Chryseobacterium manosquense]QNS40211.1 DNA-packaging protein [Chryseobacterium manosquense]